MSSDKIRIDTDKLDDVSQQLDSLSSSLSSISVSISGIAATARFVVPEQPGFIRNINSLKTRVSASSQYAHRLSGAVRGASAQWAAAESQAVGRLEEGESPFQQGGEGASGKSFQEYLDSLLQKMVGGTGAVGKIITAIWSGFDKGTVGDWIKSGADIFGAVGKLVQEGMKGTDAKWAKALFGIGKYGKTAGEAFEGALGPISWITNGIKAVVDNFDYAQDGNIPRFLTESAAETGVNVLLGAAGAAAAAAILGAGAPAIAVGALGAAAVWAVNEASKALFGSTIAEGVGEIVGDVTDWAVEKTGEAVDWVGDKVGDAVDWVADTGKQLLDTGAQALSDAGEAICGWFSWAF